MSRKVYSSMNNVYIPHSRKDTLRIERQRCTLNEFSQKQNSKIFASSLQQAQRESITQVLILFAFVGIYETLVFKILLECSCCRLYRDDCFHVSFHRQCDIYVWHSRKKKNTESENLGKLLQFLTQTKRSSLYFFSLSFCTIIDLCVYPKTKGIYFSIHQYNEELQVMYHSGKLQVL